MAVDDFGKNETPGMIKKLQQGSESARTPGCISEGSSVELKNRGEWNNEYAGIFQRKTGCIGQLALDSAESSDDAYNDGHTPEEAVGIELSYWTE